MKNISNMEIWAKKELDLILEQCEDERAVEMQQKINDHLLAMVRLFSEEGHSGSSARYTISMLCSLLNWLPPTPLTGEDDEWNTIHREKGCLQQNKRCSAVFRNNLDNKTARYIYGKVFSRDGENWYTSKDSSVSITFPYMVPIEPERVIVQDGD